MRAGLTRALIVTGAGAASVLGFAPFGLAPVAIVATAVLFYYWHGAPPRRAAWLGFAYGMGAFLAGVSWVYVSLHTFGMMPAPLAVIATVGLCAYLALFPMFAGALQARLPGNDFIKLAFMMPAAWTLTEWARGWLFTGFPWLALGYSQIDTGLRGYAPLVGVSGVTLASTVSAGLLVSLLFYARGRVALVVAVVVIQAAGVALRSVHWTIPAGSGIEVALIQGNIDQDLKFLPGRYEQITKTYLELVERSKAKLIVLPETAIPRFFDTIDADFLAALDRHAQAQGGDILVGAPTGNPRGAYYNSIVSLGVSPPQRYSKSHLVPFGEFIPPGFGWVINILQIPLSDFARGDARPRPLAVAGERVAINVCYEDTFGNEIIRQLPEATVLVNVSNVAWFGDSLAPPQHLEISRMRAYETGRAMLRATNTGVTAIIDPRSSDVKSLPNFTQGILTGHVQGYTGTTPYVRWGDTVALGMAIMMLLAGFAWRGSKVES